MKKTFKLFTLFIASAAMLMTNCKPKEDEPQGGGLEAKITAIQITNGGLSGGDMITGKVDNEALTVVFEGVPAETNIAAVKFSAQCSLGAKLEKDVIDFTEGAAADAKELSCKLKVVNIVVDSKGKEQKVEAEYTVTIKLKDAEAAPVLEKMVIKDDKGTEHTLTPANIIEGILCLGIPESMTAEAVSVTLSPARAAYKFTTAQDGIVSANNPGVFEMEFMGLKAEYEVSFSASPTPGADWSKAVVHDFSIASNNRYPDFDEEYTRGGDFDGEYVLIANRTAPKLFRIEDLLNNSVANPLPLDLTGIEGGTFPVSAGRLTQGHIYLCNLAATPDAYPLKVYHYATPNSKPEVVLEWDGTGLENPDPEIYAEYIFNARLGDGISIDLDESGNGYVFFFKGQDADDKFIRFTVTNFTQFTDVKELKMPAAANYYAMMNKVGPDQYLLTSAAKDILWLLDHDANMIREVSCNGTPIAHACDPRVIEFNRSRYLMLSNARQMAWWEPEGVNVYDISEGNDLVAALVKLDEHFSYDEDEPEEGVTPIEPIYNFTMDSEAKSGGCAALCNCKIVNGKLVIFTAAPRSGFAIIEVPRAE